MKKIRNFAIIAHIDHGKSTLADRFLELCKNIKKEDMKEQMLDSMELEREKGITIKSQCATLNYKINNEIYTLNLIDTPGHSDFAYEVSRALSACEGAILLIDASQGIEAQTVSNYNKAIKENLKIITVINKIDLPYVDKDAIKNEIETILDINKKTILEVSAKTGEGVKKLIEKIINDLPAPNGNKNEKLKALIIDSWFNNYLGIISLIKIKNGTINLNDKITVLSKKETHIVKDLGIFTPEKIHKKSLTCGEIGFLITGNKNLLSFPVGDTIVDVDNKSTKMIEGFEKIEPQIYAGIFSIITSEFDALKNAMLKLQLNDSSLKFEIQNSKILGFGLRCGFLGLLHMEIIKERLEREYEIKVIITPPNVMFEVTLKNNNVLYIDNPSKLNDIKNIKDIAEPIAKVTILTIQEYIGNVIKLCEKYRGVQKTITYSLKQVSIIYDIPMTELIFNFLEKLKKTTKGFASLDYIFYKFQKSELIKLNILLNEDTIDSLEFIFHKDEAYEKGKKIIETLKNSIPKHLFDINIKAAIGKKIIAKTTIKALRKNVTAKCYGGDITRKKKLLKKQALGKKKMKLFGKVNIPQKAFIDIFNIEKDV